MMRTQNYFRLVSTLTIAINLFVGIGALYLIERIVPAIDEVLNENAYSISAAVSMQESLNLTTEKDSIDTEDIFWSAFSKANNNVTIEGEQKILDEIKPLAERYWAGEHEVTKLLSKKLVELSELNLKAMETKNTMAKSLGLAGAWALGFLILLSLILQLTLRKKLFVSLILPISNLLNVIYDYSSGNYQRRFSGDSQAAEEIKDVGSLLNKILDENMSSQLND